MPKLSLRIGLFAAAIILAPAGAVLVHVQPAQAEDKQPLAGTWTGKTARGGQIIVTIPASGTPTYRFRGGNVSVKGAKMSGKTLVLDLGGGGSVTLKPQAGGTLVYRYKAFDGTADAVLSKS